MAQLNEFTIFRSNINESKRTVMKRFFTLTFISLFTVTAFSQSYHPIPENNATWLHTWHDWAWTEPDWHQIVFTDGDTLINTHNFIKIQEKTISQSGLITTSYVAAFRNDVTNKRVTIVPKDSTAEYLLYDFDVAVGDTINDVFSMEYYGGTITPSGLQDVYVTEVDSFLLMGSYHHIISVENGTSGLPPVNWFEGFGSNHGLLSDPGYGSVSYSQEWTCATFDGNSYSNVQDSVVLASGECPTALSVRSIESEPFDISPNPVNSEFQVSTAGNQQYSLTIHNSNGELIEKLEGLIGTVEVSTFDWKAGFYLISIVLDNDEVSHEKLIKL